VFAELLVKPRPDIVILNMNSHDNFSLVHAHDIFEQLLRVIDRWFEMDNRTKLVLTTLHNESKDKMDAKWAEMPYIGPNGTIIDRWQWISTLNSILYNASRDRFVNGKQLLMLPNLMHISKFNNGLSTDGVHMVGCWYDNIVSFIMQLVCDM
jgi:hypothetical protein